MWGREGEGGEEGVTLATGVSSLKQVASNAAWYSGSLNRLYAVDANWRHRLIGHETR